MRNKLTLIIVIVFLLVFTGCRARAVDKAITAKLGPEGMLCNFENIKLWDTSPEHDFSLSLSKKYVSEGNYSLKAAYPIEDLPSINTKRLPRDWRNFEYFSLDVYNPQDERINFTIRLDDSNKTRVNINHPLEKGMNEIKIPISQIANKIDIGSVSFIVLFLNNPDKRITLYFDNMRLEKVESIESKVSLKEPSQEKKNPALKMLLWAIDDSVKIKPSDLIQEKNYIWDSATKTVSICGARNEYVAFQLVINAEGQNISGVGIGKTDLAGTGQTIINKANIQLFREHYLKVTEPSTSMYGNVSLGKGEYPDPLVPLEAPKGGAPFFISEGRNQPIWVDIYIPDEAKGGLYQGQLIVKTEELPAQQINIQLEVWDFSLPNETHLKSFFYYGSEQIRQAHKLDSKDLSGYLDLELKYQRMAHQHRINMSTGIYHYKDWQGFLERAEKYLDGAAFVEGAGRGVGVPLWVIGEQFNTKDKTEFQEACKWYMDHFHQEGWSGKPFLYIIDEPGSKEAYDEVRKLGKWINEAPYSGNLLPFMVTEQVGPEKPEFGSLVGYVDIWCSGLGFPDDMNKRRTAGDRIWTYNGGPDGASVIIDTYGLACRSWAWTAWRYGIECWFLWDCTYWVDKHNLRGQEMRQTDLWNDPLTFDQRRNPKVKWPDWGNGDGVFFYPGYEKGINGPISSFRMKAFRRGIQDYEYLYMLKEMGKKEAADKIANSIDFKIDRNPQKWYEMRMKLVEEILKNQNKSKE